MQTPATNVNTTTFFIVAIVLGFIFGLRYFATTEERKEKFKGLKAILYSLLGLSVLSPFIEFGYNDGYKFYLETAQNPIGSILETKGTFLVLFLITSVVSSATFGVSYYLIARKSVPKSLRHLVPPLHEIFLQNRHRFYDEIKRLRGNQTHPGVLNSNGYYPNTDQLNSPARPVRSVANLLQSVTDYLKRKRMKRKINNLYKDRHFNDALTNHLIGSVAVLNDNSKAWTEEEKNSHFSYICFDLVALFPPGSARFSLRIHNSSTNCMEVKHTSHPEQKSGPVDMSKQNTIIFSAENDFATIMHSEHPEVHQKTQRNEKSREWINYICKVLLCYPENPKKALFSLCFDVMGEDADCMLRYLKEINYFNQIGKAINTCVTYFGPLSDDGVRDTIVEKDLINNIEKENVNDTVS